MNEPHIPSDQARYDVKRNHMGVEADACTNGGASDCRTGGLTELDRLASVNAVAVEGPSSIDDEAATQCPQRMLQADNQVNREGDANALPASDDPQAMDDRQWLQCMFERHHQAILRYAIQIVGDTERALDIVQDVFVRLCKQRRSDVQDHIRQWLFTVCRHRAFDVLKKENRMKPSLNVNHEQVAQQHDPEWIAQRRDSARLAGQLICDLPHNQQEVIRLKVDGGLSYREISEVTGLSVSNVGFLLHVGLKTVRNRMTEIE